MKLYDFTVALSKDRKATTVYKSKNEHFLENKKHQFGEDNVFDVKCLNPEKKKPDVKKPAEKKKKTAAKKPSKKK